MISDKFEIVKIYYRNYKRLNTDSDIIGYAQQNPDLIESIIADVRSGNGSKWLIEKLKKIRMES